MCPLLRLPNLFVDYESVRIILVNQLISTESFLKIQTVRIVPVIYASAGTGSLKRNLHGQLKLLKINIALWCNCVQEYRTRWSTCGWGMPRTTAGPVAALVFFQVTDFIP
jgi:hypothetical protein